MMTWFLKARNALILVLSWAIAMAPLQAQAMTPQKFDMYKRAIESSGLAGAKPVKLKDFYRQHQAKFPRQLQFEIENFLRQNPNADAPKLTVTKVKNKKGTDDIRVLIDFNGASQTVTILDDGTNIMQVGSATLKYSDFYNPTKLFSKVEKAINMKPDSWRSLPKSMTTPFRMATYEQMQKMNLATRTEYIKSIQDLLVTMEKMVPGEAPRAPASKGKKTSALEESILREINFFMSVIVGRAEAEGGSGDLARVEGRVKRDTRYQTEGSTACIAAGWPSWTGQMEETPKRVCLFPMESRAPVSSSQKKEVCANPSHRVCNPAIFGYDKNTNNNLCVPESNTATWECTQKSNAGLVAKEFEDQLKEAKSKIKQSDRKEAWDQFRQSTIDSINLLREICMSEDLKNEPKKIQDDQEKTCKALAERLDHVRKYSCDEPQFKIAHPEICNGNDGVAGPVQPPCECTGQQPTQAVSSAAVLPTSPTTPSNSCVVTPPPTVLPSAAGGSHTPTRQVPHSSGESPSGCFEAGEQSSTESTSTCNGGTCVQDSGSRSERSTRRSGESFWSQWKPWLIFGGIMLAGYFLMDWAWKDASRAAVDRLPQTPQPPVTVPPPPPFGGIDGG